MDRKLFMDSPSTCGKTFRAGDSEVFSVKPRGTVSVSNPPTNCVVYLESSQVDYNNKFEIVIKPASYHDCGLQLRIFDGSDTDGDSLRVLGCGLNISNRQFYSKKRAMSLMLTTNSNQYFFGSDFQLKIQPYCDSKCLEELRPFPSNKNYEFHVEAILGIVIGVTILLSAAILFGWCYTRGRLPRQNRVI